MKKLFVLLSALPILLSCVNPIDRTPVQWHTAMDLPLMNRQYFLGEVLKENADSSLALQGINTPRRGDTLSFFLSDTTSATVTQQICSFSPVTFNKKVGAITLKSTNWVSKFFTLALPNPAVDSSAVPVDLPVVDSSNVHVDSVYYVVFDTTSPDLPLKIRNASGALLTGITVQVMDHGALFTSASVDSLRAGDSVIVPCPVRGKAIDSVLTFNIQATVRSNGLSSVLHRGDGVYVGFCLNNMVITHAEINDNIAVVNNRYIQRMKISDTMELHHIDFSAIHFDVSLVDGVDEQFQVGAELLDLWDIAGCNARSVFDHASLGLLAADSAQYSKKLLLSTVIEPQGSTPITLNSPTIQQVRLFPVWDSVGHGDSASVATLAFTLRSEPWGRKITIDAADNVSLHVTPQNTTVSTATGKTRLPIIMNPNRIVKPIKFPGLTKDNSLKGRLKFNGVLMSGKISMGMPEASSIDTCALRLDFSTSAPDPVFDTLALGLQSLHDSARYGFSKDFSSILNAYPDTLTLKPSITIPPKALVTLGSDGDGVSDNTITIHAKLDYSVRLPLNFSVGPDTAQVLIADSARIGGNTGKILNRITLAQLTTNYKVRNTSGLSLRLYGIAAPQTAKRTLFGLTNADMSPAVIKTRYASQLFNLTGDSGLVVLPDDSLKNGSMTLSESDFKKFSSADTLFMRWRLQFVPVNHNATIRETDFVTINASSHVEGIQRSDSLMHAGK